MENEAEKTDNKKRLTQRERNVKFFAYMRRALKACGRMDEQLVQDVVDGKKDISEFDNQFPNVNVEKEVTEPWQY